MLAAMTAVFPTSPRQAALPVVTPEAVCGTACGRATVHGDSHREKDPAPAVGRESLGCIDTFVHEVFTCVPGDLASGQYLFDQCAYPDYC